jgi:hypothetical protein
MYLEASSIGQLILALARAGVDFPGWPKADKPWEPGPGICFRHRLGHIVSIGDSGPVRVIPKEILLVAAADHCLAAAYRGDCPGVEPEALMQWRAASRAAFQRRDVADVLRGIDEAIAALIAAPRITIGRPLGCVDGYCVYTGTLTPSHPKCECGQVVVDLRDAYFDELPEAQARLGVSVLCRGIPDINGRAGVYLMGTPSACRAFLAALDILGCDPASGYGDPQRGIVGAYRAKTEGR